MTAKNRRGRPRKYEKKGEARSVYRQNMKLNGYKAINVYITNEAKEKMDMICGSLGMFQGDLISYLVDCAIRRELPEFNYPEAL